VRVAVVIENRVDDADPAVRGCDPRRFEPRQELRDCTFDRDLVVGLHVRGRTLLADRHTAQPLLERGDRSRHAVRDGLEPEPPPRCDPRVVGDDDLERHELGPAGLRVVRARRQQGLCNTLPTRTWADVDELEERHAALRRFDAPNSDRPIIVLGDEDAAAANVVERVGPFLLPRLRFADRLGHLALERLPELAQDRLVGLNGAPDLHGRSEPVRR